MKPIAIYQALLPNIANNPIKPTLISLRFIRAAYGWRYSLSIRYPQFLQLLTAEQL